MESYRLCEASTGYVWKIIVYTGKTTEFASVVHGRDMPEMTKPTRIVLTLAAELLNHGYRIVMDDLLPFIGNI